MGVCQKETTYFWLWLPRHCKLFVQDCFGMEVLEILNNHHKEESFVRPKIDNTMIQTVMLCVKKIRFILGTHPVCLLDIGLENTWAFSNLELKGFFGTTVFKQKGSNWPKGLDARDGLCHKQGENGGCQAICQWRTIPPITNPWLACFANIKYQEHVNDSNTKPTFLPKAKYNCHVGGCHLSCRTWLVWLHTLVLLWLSCHQWHQQQSPRMPVIWEDFHIWLIGVMTPDIPCWAFCEFYVCGKKFKQNPKMLAFIPRPNSLDVLSI